jgi:hypothetical protein
MAARFCTVRAYRSLLVEGNVVRRSSSLMIVRASASMISATIGLSPNGRLGISVPLLDLVAECSLNARSLVEACAVLADAARPSSSILGNASV